MCLVTHALNNPTSYNWEGDEIIYDPTIFAMRYIPNTRKRYNLDIRKFIDPEDNVVIKNFLERAVEHIPSEKKNLFFSNNRGSYDYKVEVITEFINNKFSYLRNKKNLTPGYFLKKQLTRQKLIVKTFLFY